MSEAGQLVTIEGDGGPDRLPAVATPNEMLMRALESGAAPEVMEKMLALQERWEANQARKAFDRAMASVRANLPKLVKSSEVNFTTQKGTTHYRYEDLSSVVQALSPVLAEQGLSFRWRTGQGEGRMVSVTCIVTHEDGHAEETTLSAAVDESGNKNHIQAVGSAVTYLQRYTLKAAIGVAAGPDDDAQSAGRDRETQEEPPARTSSAQLKRDGAFDKFMANLDKLTSEDDARAWFNSTKTQDRLAAWPEKWRIAAQDALEAHIKALNSPSDDEEAPAGAEWNGDERGPDAIIEEYEQVISGIEDEAEVISQEASYLAHPALDYPGDREKLKSATKARLEAING